MGTRNLSSPFIFASFKFSRDGKAREEGARYISSSFCTFFELSHEVRARQKGTRHLSFSFFSASFVFSRDGFASFGRGNALPLLRVPLRPNSLSSIFFRRPSTQTRRGGKGKEFMPTNLVKHSVSKAGHLCKGV